MPFSSALLAAALQVSNPPATGLSLGAFMEACVASGGDLGWFGPSITGSSPLRGVYIGDAPARVTVSFFNEDGSGSSDIRWFNSANPPVEVRQPASIPESYTIVSRRVRYGVSGTRAATAVCTRVH
jgi:hypothetical protein